MTDEPFESVLAHLSLEEKVRLMSGGGMFSTAAVPRLGIPALQLRDGPAGVRSVRSRPATAFPSGVAIGASWNTLLARQVAGAIAGEAAARGIDIVLAPMVNLQRAPLAGRNFETFSEDPVLAGELAAAVIIGLQERGVGACLKHFAANNHENERLTGDVRIAEPVLRELYLAAFGDAVARADPWTVMTAYNKVNGTYASEHRYLLETILRGEWGYEGLVMSDWGGTHATDAAARHGIDLEMPGPPAHFGDRLLAAVRSGRVPESAVDVHVRRLLRLVDRVQEGRPRREAARRGDTVADRRAVAREAAAAGMVLLKNAGARLPLDRRSLRRVAVLGPNAAGFVLQGGGSAQLPIEGAASALEAIAAHLGPSVEILHVPGVAAGPLCPEMRADQVSLDAAGVTPGLAVAFYDDDPETARPLETGVERSFYKFGFGPAGAAPEGTDFAACWEGFFHPPVTGSYRFDLVHTGEAALWLDGAPLIGDAEPAEPSPLLPFLDDVGIRTAEIRLEAGRAVPLRVEYRAPGADAIPVLRLGVRPPVGSIAAAAAAARAADATIVIVGSGDGWETEGRDRPHMGLSGEQDALVEAVLAADPEAVVVVNTGAPVALPWIAVVPAVLEAWFPGEQGAAALADILFGAVNPSGKLPLSFPRRLADAPETARHPGGAITAYAEGRLIGYRHYDRAGIAPLFPFGHGLSYTRFRYAALRIARRRGGVDASIVVNFTLANIGARPGTEIAQVYLCAPATEPQAPIAELKGFIRLPLDPGERREVSVILRERDFARYDARRGAWRPVSGRHEVRVGASARDIRLRTEFDYPASGEDAV